MTFLHLLNGDATRVQFEQTSIPGDKAVWREILCEGPAVADMESDAFWHLRGQFLLSVSKFSYEKHFWRQQELVLKRDFKPYDEVVLWFEYDLFCQLNLLGVLSWLYGKGIHSSKKISLVCVGKHPKYDKLVGLGEIDAKEYATLFQGRVPLAEADLKYGADLWNLYCSTDHQALIDKVEENHPKFPYLFPAIQCHQKRFPSEGNGLNEIEQQMMEMIGEGVEEKRKIVRKILQQENYYGFGDLQYFKILEGLKPLLEEEDGRVRLNEFGEQVINGRMDFMRRRASFPKYGGVSIHDYRWDGSRLRLNPVN